MKKLILLVCVTLSIMLTSCDSSTKHMYTQEEMQEAVADAEYIAYKRGYEEGYAVAKHEGKGELERINSEYGDNAYEAGYEAGYEDGYCDGLGAN